MASNIRLEISKLSSEASSPPNSPPSTTSAPPTEKEEKPENKKSLLNRNLSLGDLFKKTPKAPLPKQPDQGIHEVERPVMLSPLLEISSSPIHIPSSTKPIENKPISLSSNAEKPIEDKRNFFTRNFSLGALIQKTPKPKQPDSFLLEKENPGVSSLLSPRYTQIHPSPFGEPSSPFSSPPSSLPSLSDIRSSHPGKYNPKPPTSISPRKRAQSLDRLQLKLEKSRSAGEINIQKITVPSSTASHSLLAQSLKKDTVTEMDIPPLIREALGKIFPKLLTDEVKRMPQDDFYQQLAHLTLSSETCSLVYKYYGEIIYERDRMVQVLYKFLKTKSDFLKVIENLTTYEISIGQKEILFRDDTLVSALATTHCKDGLEKMLEPLISHLKVAKGEELCFDRTILQRECIGKELDQREAGNLKHFELFVEKALGILYSIECSAHLREMLTVRKNCLASRPPAEVYVMLGEFLFFRMINPYLVNHLDCLSSPLKRSAVISFSKILQSIANNVYFGDEKCNKAFERFNPIIKKFERQHHLFLEKNSMFP